MKLDQIIRHYIKGRFVFDLIIYGSYVIAAASHNKWLYLLILMKTIKVKNVMDDLVESLTLSDNSQGVYQLISLQIVIISTAHFFACGFHLIHTIELEHGVETTWVLKNRLDEDSSFGM